MRFDHYDYLSEPNLVSPHAGLRCRGPAGHRRARVHVAADDRAGRDEFLPPSRLRAVVAACAHVFPARALTRRFAPSAFGGTPSVWTGVRTGPLRHARPCEWFAEDTNNQMATLFGVDAGSEVAPYYVATVGNVGVTGWRSGLEGVIARNVTGRVDYTEGKARVARDSRRHAPSRARAISGASWPRKRLGPQRAC